MTLMDYTDYIAAIAQILLRDQALWAMVDGQVIPGLRRDKAGDYLKKSKHCCIGVRALDETSKGLPGAAYHGGSDNDLMIEFDVINISDSDTYAGKVAAKAKDLIRRAPSINMGAVMFQILPSGIDLKPIQDDKFSDRFHVIGTVRIKYYG